MNLPDQLGHTPMHTLAFHGSLKENIEVVKYAASICENPNPQDDFGSTPMHIAAELGYLEFVRALIPYWNNKHLLNHVTVSFINLPNLRDPLINLSTVV